MPEMAPDLVEPSMCYSLREHKRTKGFNSTLTSQRHILKAVVSLVWSLDSTSPLCAVAFLLPQEEHPKQYPRLFLIFFRIERLLILTDL